MTPDASAAKSADSGQVLRKFIAAHVRSSDVAQNGLNEISVELQTRKQIQTDPQQPIEIDCILDAGPAFAARKGRQLTSVKLINAKLDPAAEPDQHFKVDTSATNLKAEGQPNVVSYLHGMPTVGVWQPVETSPRVRHHSFRKPPKQPLPVNPYESTSTPSTTVLSFTWLTAAAALVLGLLLSLALNCFLCRTKSAQNKKASNELNLPPYQTYEATSSCASSSFAGDGNGECESVFDDTSSIASSSASNLGFVIKYPSRPPRPENIYGFTVYAANRY